MTNPPFYSSNRSYWCLWLALSQSAVTKNVSSCSSMTHNMTHGDVIFIIWLMWRHHASFLEWNIASRNLGRKPHRKFSTSVSKSAHSKGLSAVKKSLSEQFRNQVKFHWVRQTCSSYNRCDMATIPVILQNTATQTMQLTTLLSVRTSISTAMLRSFLGGIYRYWCRYLLHGMFLFVLFLFCILNFNCKYCSSY